MSSCTQRLFEKFPTLGAHLTGVLGWNGNYRYTEYRGQILYRLKKWRISLHRQPPQGLNHRPFLGEAIAEETRVKLRVEPLGPRKLRSEDQRIGPQWGVISLGVFHPGFEPTIADASWWGLFPGLCCHPARPLGLFELMRYCLDQESNGLKIYKGFGSDGPRLSLRRYTTLIYSTPIKSRLERSRL